MARDQVRNDKALIELKLARDHKIIECFGLERTFSGHLSQTPLPWAGTPSTRPGCSEHCPTWPESFQGWGLHYLSGQSVPVYHHPHGKKFLLISSLNLPSLSLKPLLLVLSQQVLLKKIFPVFPIGFRQVLKGCYKVSPRPSLLQAEQSQLSQTFLIGKVFQPSDHLCGPPLDPLQQLRDFLCWGLQS